MSAPDYDVLRERLEAEGFTVEGDVHCNWFWAQMYGKTPDERPFYYRLKHGWASLTWTHLTPDLSVEHADEEVDEDPSPDVVIASLHRLIEAADRAGGALGDTP